eukprot:8547216-Pyramimonas_sp.AAC.1
MSSFVAQQVSRQQRRGGSGAPGSEPLEHQHQQHEASTGRYAATPFAPGGARDAPKRYNNRVTGFLITHNAVDRIRRARHFETPLRCTLRDSERFAGSP